MSLSKFTFSLCTLDLLTRSYLNTFILNNLYFFWTSLWYLYLFFFTIIFCYIFVKFSKVSWFHFVISTLFLIFNFILYKESFFSNFLTTDVMTNGENINILLKNSVNKIHPFLLYSSSSIFFATLPMFFIFRGYKVLGESAFYNMLIINKISYCLLYILVALYLGSWWALQEGSWGGWWNWDPSEFFGLIILFFILSFFHVKLNLKCTQWLYYFSFISISYLFIFFLLLQLNFSIISHNFGFRSIKFINIEILVSSLLIYYTMCYLSYYKIIHFNSSMFLRSINVVPNFLFVLRVALLTFNFIVLVALTSFFVKIILNFKFFLTFLTFSKLLLTVFICFYLRFLYLTHNLGFLIFCNITCDYIVLLYLSTVYNYKTKYVFHYIIFIVVTLSIFFKNSVLNDYIYTDFTSLRMTCEFISTNLRDLELLLNFISTSSTFESKSFDLVLTNNYTYQIYLISSSVWYFHVTTIDNVPSMLNTLLSILLFLIVCQYTYKVSFNK